ncbi:uncharacterized protein LOC130284131 [Hyla sarda]|uniref:uncharacterized protein LOC130284131 n=1 Tax=Hyla sarda TaxID=327740 RepID=UPI0024C2A471|nr:uncharacterized protein LOC130284131 [Hyla sarda]
MEEIMCQKLKQMRKIMEKTSETTTGKNSSPGHNVVIVSALEEKDVQWLYRILSSRHFQEQVQNLKSVSITKTKEKNWEKLMGESTFCIYLSNENEWVQGAAASQRIKPLSARGKRNLVVVIDEVKISNEEQKTQILQVFPDIEKYALGLLLFSRMEKESDYERFLTNFLQPRPDINRRGSQAAIAPKVMLGIRYKVGIFSRSADREYSWMMTLLASELFRDHVLSVRPCFISNNGKQRFNEDLSHCTFGILYHTKNFGRVNITDVRESLYDEEIQDLSMTLGKKNVIVVIDDLEDTSDQVKSRILQTQPKIAQCAKDLVLISYEDKADNMGHSAKSKLLKCFLSLPDDRYPPENSRYENNRGVGPYSSIERPRSPSSMAPPELPPSSMTHATPTPSRSAIGIFSRLEEADYLWLRRWLTSEDFGHKDVLCCKVSGNDEEMQKVAFRSKFGILYHSGKNGKIRLTDAVGSLYQEELEKLSAKLGKKRMMVVVDDLDDSGDKLKQKILEKQPSLGRLAAEIFLFTAAEKKEIDHQSQGKHHSKMSKSTSNKISSIKKCLT